MVFHTSLSCLLVAVKQDIKLFFRLPHLSNDFSKFQILFVHRLCGLIEQVKGFSCSHLTATLSLPPHWLNWNAMPTWKRKIRSCHIQLERLLFQVLNYYCCRCWWSSPNDVTGFDRKTHVTLQPLFFQGKTCAPVIKILHHAVLYSTDIQMALHLMDSCVPSLQPCELFSWINVGRLSTHLFKWLLCEFW